MGLLNLVAALSSVLHVLYLGQSPTTACSALTKLVAGGSSYSEEDLGRKRVCECEKEYIGVHCFP